MYEVHRSLLVVSQCSVSGTSTCKITWTCIPNRMKHDVNPQLAAIKVWKDWEMYCGFRTLTMEAIRASETLVTTARRHDPEVHDQYLHYRENLKLNTFIICALWHILMKLDSLYCISRSIYTRVNFIHFNCFMIHITYRPKHILGSFRYVGLFDWVRCPGSVKYAVFIMQDSIIKLISRKSLV
jgi:hypothetical protein